MIFGYFTLAVALIISTIAEYYSIVGLMAIFAASPISIAVMGAALGVGKITGAVWLKINWTRANWKYKLYLSFAVTLLMILTSIGCFGFLSKAHSDQNLVSGDTMAKVAIYDEKIKTAKDNIDTNRRALKQLDEAVDQVMGRSNDEKGADKAVAIRRSQQKERARLLAEIEVEQKKASQLSEERAPLAAEFRKVESEVGPIKYIAALIYGDNPDANILERSVRWVIILIVAVFDPLALVLILAAQQSIRWAREEQEQQTYPTIADLDREVGEPPTAEELQLQEEQLPGEVNKYTQAEQSEGEPVTGQDPHPPGWMFEDSVAREPVKEVEPAYLKNSKDFWKKPEGWVSVGPLVANAVPEVKTEETALPEVKKPRKPRAKKVVDPVVEQTTGDSPERPGDYVEERVPEARRAYKAPPPPPPPETLNIKKSQLQADNVTAVPVNSSFGIEFPESAGKGDMFLRVDYLPNRLYKFNGNKWIEVDKSKTDSYSYDEQYIQFLIEKLQSGEYDLDQLSTSEQELVAEKLKQITNDKT